MNTLTAPLSPDPARDAAPDAVATLRRVRRRTTTHSALVLAAAAAATVGAFACRVLLGDFTVTVPDFFRILFGAEIPGASFIVWESKLPRAVAAVLAGGAFGAAGAAFQGMLRNPIASPDVLGLSLGASAAAVVALVVLGWSGTPVAVAAALGALAASGILLTAGAGRRMILVGIGLAAALQAVVHWLLLRAQIFHAQDAMVWLSGSLNPATWSQLRVLAVVVAIGLPLLAFASTRLRVVELGDDAAIALGVRPPRVRASVTLLVVLLVAGATAVTGPIAFVSLLSGPIARRLQGGRVAVVTAAFVGATIVLLADHVAAYHLPNLPVGVVTGAAGAPFLLWLLTRSRHLQET